MHKKWFKIIEKFNTPDTALVVSAWPVYGKNAVNHGIAWYTEMTVTEMAKKQNKKFVILAEKNHDNQPQLLVDGKVLVLRIFDNKKKSLYPVILQYLAKFDQVKKVYVHSEFGVNGGMVHFALILPFLAMIRAMGKQITYYSHNVVTDVAMLAGHLNISNWQGAILNQVIKIYYKLLDWLCNRIVVLDPILKDKLVQYVTDKKIVSLQMPVEEKHKLGKAKARKQLGLPLKQKIITYFGFVSWYKGTDWLVKQMSKYKDNDVMLVVAGGPSYSLADKPHYKRYYDGITKLIEINPNIRITGFLTEEQVAQYMSAADLVVLPYRGFMGSSGSLSQALSYSKPFMVSEKMKEILNDLRKDTDLSFALSRGGFNKIVKTVKSKNLLLEMRNIASEVARERSLGKLARHEYVTLYA